MISAGSPGNAQINAVMMAGTATGSIHATSNRTAGLSHHRFTSAPSLGYLPYFQLSNSVK